MTKRINDYNVRQVIFLVILIVFSSCSVDHIKHKNNPSTELEIIKLEKLAKKAYDSDDYSSALNYYLKLSKLDSLNTNYLIRLAKLETFQQNNKASIKYFKRVLEMNPKDTIALLGISTVCAKIMDDSLGSFYIDQYLAMYPNGESGLILKETFKMIKHYRNQ